MKVLNNKILEVNLNHKKFSECPILEKILEECIGGRGLEVKLLTSRIPANLNLLNPKNLLIFSS